MENNNLSDQRNALLIFLWNQRKSLLLFTGVAAVLSVIVAFIITPLYLSTAIVFAAASSNVSFSEQRNVKAAAMDFGEEEQAEQLVQILSSSRIRDRIVQKYDLMKDYEISKTDPNKFYKLNKAYNEQKHNINLLLKNGSILELSKASDNLNISSLSSTVTKYFLASPYLGS